MSTSLTPCLSPPLTGSQRVVHERSVSITPTGTPPRDVEGVGDLQQTGRLLDPTSYLRTQSTSETRGSQDTTMRIPRVSGNPDPMSPPGRRKGVRGPSRLTIDFSETTSDSTPLPEGEGRFTLGTMSRQKQYRVDPDGTRTTLNDPDPRLESCPTVPSLLY